MTTYAELYDLRNRTFAQCMELTREMNRHLTKGPQYWSEWISHVGATLSGLVQVIHLLDDELAAMKPQDTPPPQDESRNRVILLED